MKNDLWTRDELVVVLSLYWKTPYNKISGTSNPQIKEAANTLGRTPSAIAYKLMNLTSLDSERQDKGNKGKDRSSKLDEEIWNEYFNDWEGLAFDSAKILANIQGEPIEKVMRIEDDIADLQGREKERFVKVRVNQNDFRQRILASYGEQCCITKIDASKLLVASHIIPWAKNEAERLNPKNGLCLNPLHDKAFDQGLLTITPDFRVRLSQYLLKKKNDSAIQDNFIKFDNQLIRLPDRHLPNPDFLAWHNYHIFEQL